MRQEKRLKQKRQRKAKRVEKFEKRETRRFGNEDFRPTEATRALLHASLIAASGSIVFPGSCHPSVARPDVIKLDFTEWIRKKTQWSRKQRDLERRMSDGPMRDVAEIDHWAMEEFFYHGLPEDSENPLDAWLDSEASALPQEAIEQIRQWKQAKPGIFEIVGVKDHLVSLRPCGPDGQPNGEPVIQAISLNLEGVTVLAGHRGKLLFTYLAPWNVDKGISCAMGYSCMTPRQHLAEFRLLSNLRDPAVVAASYPWKCSGADSKTILNDWKKRDWQGYLKERVTCPFDAVSDSPSGLQVFRINRIVDSSAEAARVNGIYFDAPVPAGSYFIGGTCIVPVDLGSRNAQLFAEYRAYRDIVGPPRASKGKPKFMYEAVPDTP